MACDNGYYWDGKRCRPNISKTIRDAAFTIGGMFGAANAATTRRKQKQMRKELDALSKSPTEQSPKPTKKLGGSIWTRKSNKSK